jgi:periplasmic protein CpxP/Spy
MNTSKYRMLIFLVVFLLLTNIGMLLYFTVFNKPVARDSRNDKRGSGITAFLQQDLGFSKTQMDTLDILKKQHRIAIRPLFEELGKSKDALYGLIGKPGSSDSVLKAATADIGRKQAALDLQFFQNFMGLRKLCTEPQLPKFDSAMPALASRMMQPWKKNNNPRKKDSTAVKN